MSRWRVAASFSYTRQSRAHDVTRFDGKPLTAVLRAVQERGADRLGLDHLQRGLKAGALIRVEVTSDPPPNLGAAEVPHARLHGQRKREYPKRMSIQAEPVPPNLRPERRREVATRGLALTTPPARPGTGTGQADGKMTRSNRGGRAD